MKNCEKYNVEYTVPTEYSSVWGMGDYIQDIELVFED
jgi:hypothetical protein